MERWLEPRGLVEAYTCGVYSYLLDSAAFRVLTLSVGGMGGGSRGWGGSERELWRWGELNKLLFRFVVNLAPAN